MPYRNENFKHVFVIGTNRFLEDCLESYIHEIRFMEEYLGEKVPFLIIEESDWAVEQRNGELITGLREQYPDILLVHFDSSAQRKYFKHFLDAGIKKELVDLLDFKGLSYGRIMNKQFLLAATFGADYIHRRDSDTKVMDEFGFPAEMELKYLGKSVFEANSLLPEVNIEYHGDKKIYLVGSGYSGGSDWKIDYSLFIPQDANLILQVNSLLGYSEELSEQYYTEVITRANVVTEEAKYLPKANHSNPDCGNISFYKLHRYLPCPPVPNTTGTDYFAVNVLKCTELPIIYHNHFVHHGFTGERKKDNIEYAYSYWPRVVNLMDYYEAFAKSMFAKLINSSIGCMSIDDINALEMFEGMGAELEDERRKRISDFGQIFLSAQNTLLNDIGAFFKDAETQEEIVRNSNSGLENHRKLLTEWPDIIKAAEKYNIEL